MTSEEAQDDSEGAEDDSEGLRMTLTFISVVGPQAHEHSGQASPLRGSGTPPRPRARRPRHSTQRIGDKN